MSGNVEVLSHDWLEFGFMKSKGRAYWATAVLIVVNVAIFLALSFRGMTEDAVFLMEHGAMYVPRMVEQGEYYRMFTCMFLHFGFEHLAGNMMALAIVGGRLEQEFGKVKYLFLYLAGGVCSSVISSLWEIYKGSYAIAAGASGAVFALVGALLFVSFRAPFQEGGISVQRVAFMVILMLYYGFANTGVDNAAHIGGLLSGFVLSVLLYRKHKREYAMPVRNG